MRLPSKAARLGILGETVDRMARAKDLEVRVTCVWNAFAKLGLTDNVHCIVYALTRKSTLTPMFTYNMSEAAERRRDIPLTSNSLSGWVATHERVVIITDLQKSNKMTHVLKPPSTRSLAAIPLFDEGETIGVLTTESSKAGRFSSDLVSTLAPYGALLGKCARGDEVRVRGGIISLVAESRKKQVLLLGKDSGEEFQRLLEIASLLQHMGYIPLLVKQNPDIPEMSNEEKVRVFADHARFVILENTFPAGQIAEMKICSTNRIITATLREEGKGSSFMVTDYFNDYRFMQEFVYTQEAVSLRRAIVAAVDWAEVTIKDRVAYYNSLYPWRDELGT